MSYTIILLERAISESNKAFLYYEKQHIGLGKKFETNLYKTLYKVTMKMTTYSDVRANLAKSMDIVCENREPLFIRRQKGRTGCPDVAGGLQLDGRNRLSDEKPEERCSN